MAGTTSPISMPLRAIDVEYPELVRARVPDGTLMVTSLFRERLFLDELLGSIQRTRRRAGKLSILSAGCSNGAEADTILSLHNISGDSRPVVMRGLDFNPAAIKAAKAAKYLLPLAIYEGETYDTAVSELRSRGFAVDPEPIYQLNEPWGEQGYVEIDASPVRQGHDVDFMQHDLRTAIPTGIKADLVLANHVLYHLTVPSANAALRTVAGAVKQGGLLSLGGVANREMEGSDIFYPDWLRGAEGWLASDMGMLRVNSMGDQNSNIFIKV